MLKGLMFEILELQQDMFFLIERYNAVKYISPYCKITLTFGINCCLKQ